MKLNKIAMPKHLFIFTVGPVQSFIAQARKAQDLFAGSQLLSDQLSLCINETIRQGHEIIFPFTNETHINAGASKLLTAYRRTIPNRFVAILNLDDPQKVKAFGESLEKLVEAALVDTAINLFSKYNLDITQNGIKEELLDVQEKYWAAIPFDPASQEYGSTYQKLEQYLGAIKRTRKFKQISQIGRKCSINGFYNVKLYRKSAEEESRRVTNDIIKSNKLFNNENLILHAKDSTFKLRIIQPGEGLSGISLLKRIYQEASGTYPSTAKVALEHLQEDPELAKLVDQYSNLFESDFDEQLLYEENLTTSYLEKYGITPLRDLKTLTREQSAIKKLASDKGLKLSKHYAILRFDGDNMGEWLSQAKDMEQHRELSKVLLEFAEEAKKLVNDQLGKTIYAGGDDFLALLNLKNLFPVLSDLNQKIKDLNRQFPVKRPGHSFSVTFSVFICHYKVPLNKALQLSDNLLKATKENFSNDGKNGIGIAFFKKSGIIGEVMLKNNQIQLLKDTIPLMLEKQFNPKFIYRFGTEFSLWKGGIKSESSSDHDAQYQLIETEFIRLLKRSCENKQHLTTVETYGQQLFNQLIENDANERKLKLDNLENTIRILEAYNATI